MKTKKIQKIYHDAIMSGDKYFEIRKDKYLEGEVILIVLEHTESCNKGYNSGKCFDTEPALFCIKDSVKVNLKKTDMSSYKIACFISNKIFMSKNNSKEWNFWQKIHSFLMNWTKDNQPLYWYDITHIWYKDEWVEYEEYRNLVNKYE